MYRVLFATNEPAVLEPLNQITNWQSMSFHDPVLAGNADEAIRLMESKRVDAIAYMLNADEARKLSLYLNNMRPSLPIFQIQRTLDAQKEEIINVRRLLDRLHADMSDEVYDEAAVLDILRDEVTHNLLAGEVAADAQLRGTVQLLRSFVSPDKQAILFDLICRRARCISPPSGIMAANGWKTPCATISLAVITMIFITAWPCLPRGISAWPPASATIQKASPKKTCCKRPTAMWSRCWIISRNTWAWIW